MGFPVGGNIANATLGNENTLGAYTLQAMNGANNSYNSFWNNMNSQLTNQTSQLMNILGPQATNFSPQALPGIGNTGPSGDQSMPNLGRASILGY